MEKNKGTLTTIIILLIIFIPASIIGTYNHFKDPNENHDFIFEGSLYFYDNDELLGTYKCKTTTCDYASYTLLDKDNQVLKTSLYNKQYAYIKDGDNIYLQDIVNGWNITEYKELYGYSLPIDNNSIIVKNINDKYGIVSIEESVKVYLESKYDSIKLNPKWGSAVTSLDKIIVKSETNWQIINDKKEAIFTSENEIKNFSDNYVVLATDTALLNIVNYKNEAMFSDLFIYDIEEKSNFIIISANDKKIVYEYMAEPEFIYNEVGRFEVEYDIKMEGNVLNVYNGEELVDTIKSRVNV